MARPQGGAYSGAHPGRRAGRLSSWAGQELAAALRARAAGNEIRALGTRVDIGAAWTLFWWRYEEDWVGIRGALIAAPGTRPRAKMSGNAP